ncbi:MAG: efflux RND transporter periplasmic adaptor subunit [bacterium]|nr:efflux RND transporter periplasmic adaptor subunit [bacterium]
MNPLKEAKPLPTTDTPSTEETRVPREAPSGNALKWLSRFVRLILIAVILAVSSGIAYYWMTNRPQAKRRPPKPEATLVEVAPVTLGTERVVVRAMGTVVPAVEVQVAARIGGQIVEVSPRFTPGSHFGKEDILLEIDPADYALAVKQRQADLVSAESSLRLEMGQQSIAKREYELLGELAEDGDEDLLLRQPQLDSTQAVIAVAKAALEKAQLDLRRTTVRAPFNAVVQSRNVDLGSYVGPGTPLATLVGVDEYWIETTVPIDELKWLDVPGDGEGEGSAARVFHEAAWGSDAYRSGVIARLMTDLEPQGHMTRLLVTVADPLQLKDAENERHPLILGLKVRIEIEGKEMDRVVKVPRTALREGIRVWVMTADGLLEVREVQIVWESEEYVFVSDGLANGDLLVLSDLATPVAGMVLRTADTPPEGGKKRRKAEGSVKEQP